MIDLPKVTIWGSTGETIFNLQIAQAILVRITFGNLLPRQDPGVFHFDSWFL